MKCSPLPRLSRIVKLLQPTGAEDSTSISVICAADGGAAVSSRTKVFSALIRALDKNLDAFFSVQHPAVRAYWRERGGRRTGESPLPAPRRELDGTSTRHKALFQVHDAAASLPADLDHFAVLNEQRERCAGHLQARAFGRARLRSASTSYSTKSVPFHSSHSRISCVYWQRFVP